MNRPQTPSQIATTTEILISLDQLVAMALSAQLSAWEAKQYLEERAARGDWGKFEAILKRVPDREPDPEDQFN